MVFQTFTAAPGTEIRQAFTALKQAAQAKRTAQNAHAMACAVLKNTQLATDNADDAYQVALRELDNLLVIGQRNDDSTTGEAW